MKAARFDRTPEFQHFRDVMRGVLSVPKERLDELVRKSKAESAKLRAKRAKKKIGQ